MERSNLEKQREPEVPRFLDFPHLSEGATHDGEVALNRYSAILTKDHDFPGAQVGTIKTPVNGVVTLNLIGHVVCCRSS